MIAVKLQQSKKALKKVRSQQANSNLNATTDNGARLLFGPCFGKFEVSAGHKTLQEVNLSVARQHEGWAGSSHAAEIPQTSPLHNAAAALSGPGENPEPSGQLCPCRCRPRGHPHTHTAPHCGASTPTTHWVLPGKGKCPAAPERKITSADLGGEPSKI